MNDQQHASLNANHAAGQISRPLIARSKLLTRVRHKLDVRADGKYCPTFFGSMPLAPIGVLHRVGVVTNGQYFTLVHNIVKYHHFVFFEKGRWLWCGRSIGSGHTGSHLFWYISKK